MIPSTGDSTTVTVIGEQAAKGLAVNLEEEWNVRLLSEAADVVESAASNPVEARHVDYAASDIERHACGADVVVVVTARDRTALLVTQLLNTICDVGRVFVTVDDPRHRDAFEGIDCEVVETGSLLRSEVEHGLTAGEG